MFCNFAYKIVGKHIIYNMALHHRHRNIHQYLSHLVLHAPVGWVAVVRALGAIVSSHATFFRSAGAGGDGDGSEAVVDKSTVKEGELGLFQSGGGGGRGRDRGDGEKKQSVPDDEHGWL